MVAARKKRQQNKRLLSQLSESDTDFMIGRNNHETHTESGTNTVEKNMTSNNANDPTQANSSQVDVHTLEKNIVGKVRSEVGNVMAMVQTRVQDAILTAMKSVMIPRVELAIKSVNASFRQNTASVVPESDQSDFSRNIEGLQVAASNRKNSNTDSNKIVENRGNNTVKGGDLSVNERNFDRKTHTHHSNYLFMHKIKE